jgi:L-asparagine oxygenase
MVSDGNIAEYRLSQSERRVVNEMIAQIRPYRPDDLPSFMTQCSTAGALLPSRLRGWAHAVQRTHIGLLRNVPVGDDLPPTPKFKGEIDRLPLAADAALGLVAALFGEIVTFEGKVTSRQIHNVYPAQDEEPFSQLGASSSQLDWHVEDGFHPDRAEWLGILCLRSDPQVTTWVARAQDLDLNGDDWSALREEPMILIVDDSFGPPYCGRPFERMLITGPLSDPEIAFDPPYTHFRNEAERMLCQRVSAAAERAKIALSLEVGDVLLLNNRHVIHARSSFAPRFDGSDRWIKRALVAEDIKRTCLPTPGLVAFPQV